MIRKTACISILSLLPVLAFMNTYACSVVYYVDQSTGKIYVANNEDYWYDVKAYVQIIPGSKKEMARIWYGWDDFAQGGMNEAGLFFDGAVTPEQPSMDKSGSPKGNLGDKILANCADVKQALDYLDKKKIALNNAHMMIGDSTGNAVVIEWLDGEQKLISIRQNHLSMTNFLLSDTLQGNYPCYRYNSIEERIKILQEKNHTVTLKEVGNVLGQAAQIPRADANQRIGGTLYSTFIGITDMEFVLVYKLDNSKITKLDLKQEFNSKKKHRIELK